MWRRAISMRMYGRENSAVVIPMNAVSVARKILNGSMKNCSWRNVRFPSTTTRALSAHAPSRVAALNTTFASGAQRRAPNHTMTNAPSSGEPINARNTTLRLLLARLEPFEVEAVELLADLEEEHAEHEHRDQHIERDAHLDDHRHAVGGAHRAEEQAVLHR